MKKSNPSQQKRAAITHSVERPPFDWYDSDDDAADRAVPTVQRGWSSLVALLRGRKRIAVLTGAGISVSCGIPDFRTKDSGLYDSLDTQALGITYPEDLFDAHFFRENPLPFYQFARRLYFPLGTTVDAEGRETTVPIRPKPSDAHKLLALLEEKKMLLRVYSQNIDGLEEEAGVPAKRICYAHGSLHWASCGTCHTKVRTTEFFESHILRGVVPYCQAPLRISSSSSSSSNNNGTSEAPRATPIRTSARKRAWSAASPSFANPRIGPNGEAVCGGVMKPGVTFFGEALHNTVKQKLEWDRDRVDALIVIGTSLSVAPISKVIDYLPRNIPRILINRTIVHPPESLEDDGVHDDDDDDCDFRKNYVFDAYLLGDCDVVTRALAQDLFRPPKEMSSSSISPSNVQLLTTLLQESPAAKKEWNAMSVPSERVFIFPGAEAPPPNASEPTWRELAHCDGCTQPITTGTIQKCSVCFDYDLCPKCYPFFSQTHYNGEHAFAAEAACSD